MMNRKKIKEMEIKVNLQIYNFYFQFSILIYTELTNAKTEPRKWKKQT